jgi:Fur family peroxide stress response transcriptional regulator
VCTTCGEIVDLEASFLHDVPEKVSRETGYQIVSHRLDFYGICPQCQAAVG